MKCVDCGFDTGPITERTLRKGSSVRDPGEAVCPSCTSSRVILMRMVDKIPRTLAEIRAKRMVRA